MRRVALAAAFVFVAAAAHAQSPYVAATIGADVLRTNHSESNVAPSSPAAGSEVVSWSLRVGTDVGQNWGAELEFVRSGRSHSSTRIGGRSPLDPFATFTPGTTVPLGTPGTPGSTTSAIPVPIGLFQTDIRRNHSDFDTALWARQRVSRVELVFVGGIAFSRERTEITQTFPTVLRVLLPVPAGNFRTTTITYSTRPLVGTEARIGLTSHVRLIPGVRLQGVPNGWLVRPYAGLGWFF